jgi:hypothetical protein
LKIIIKQFNICRPKITQHRHRSRLKRRLQFQFTPRYQEQRGSRKTSQTINGNRQQQTLQLAIKLSPPSRQTSHSTPTRTSRLIGRGCTAQVVSAQVASLNSKNPLLKTPWTLSKQKSTCTTAGPFKLRQPSTQSTRRAKPQQCA